MSYRPSAENMAEAEAAVLGSLLLDPEGCAPKVLPVLRASDFSDPANAEVFATIVELADEQVYAGTFPDHNSVRFRLREKKKLEQLPGGDAYLTILAESVAALWSLPAHVDLVRRESCRRRLTRRAAWLQRELAAGADPYELAATIAGELEPDALAAPRKGAATIKPAPISELMGKKLPPVRWVIDYLLPEGLAVLAGAPKTGKSWLALDISLAVSRGERILGGYDTSGGEVLYLALEDSERGLQGRVNAIADEERYAGNSKFFYETEIPGMLLGGVGALDAWLTAHPDCVLVVIDTLARFVPPAERGVNAYQSDYAVLAQLQDLCKRHGIALLAVHHTRKAKSEDVFDAVSGSRGVTACADTNWVLERSRGEREGKLSVTGRNIEEQLLAADFDSETFRWTIAGDMRQDKRRKQLVALRSAFGDSAFTFDAARLPLGVELRQSKNVINGLLSTGHVERLEERQGKAFLFRLTDRAAAAFTGGA